jgi:hypothetical protein
LASSKASPTLPKTRTLFGSDPSPLANYTSADFVVGSNVGGNDQGGNGGGGGGGGGGVDSVAGVSIGGEGSDGIRVKNAADAAKAFKGAAAGFLKISKRRLNEAKRGINEAKGGVVAAAAVVKAAGASSLYKEALGAALAAGDSAAREIIADEEGDGITGATLPQAGADGGEGRDSAEEEDEDEDEDAEKRDPLRQVGGLHGSCNDDFPHEYVLQHGFVWVLVVMCHCPKVSARTAECSYSMYFLTNIYVCRYIYIIDIYINIYIT